jgi:NB-ARC domain/APAF-1 helical domain
MQEDIGDNATAFQTTVEGGAAYIGVNHIYQQSRPSRGITFEARDLPKYYVDRPEIRQKIKSKLIDCSVSRPGTLVVSAIYGLGGVGKSVMAAALAHDAEVQKVCADGVLWVTLGQNPDLLSSLYAWVQKLGDYDFKPTNVDSASSHLRSLLHDKKMLLVVDDAWKTSHVTPFQVGGEGCRVLVTTREAYVHDAERIDMDVMSEAEALKLLLSKLPEPIVLTADENQQAEKLVEVVGYLPLAVELIAAQILEGKTWGELLEDLEAEIAYLETLDLPNAEGEDDEQTRKKMSLKASLNLSLKLLTEEQIQYFAWLGVLPEDVAIQPEMAATLWSVPRKRAGEVLRTFRAKALLLSGVQGLGQESSYRIHDLMHDLARGLLTSEGEKDIPGLGLHWSEAHGILLDRYRQQATNNLWHTLPNDSYIYSYLTWHMEQAGRLSELHGLFQEVTAEGRNGWYERCDFLGQNAKFVIDLGRAWKLAEETYEEDKGESIRLQIRYALIFSTLNSLVNKIPVELIAALVKNKKWSPSQGLAYAKQAHEPRKCSDIIRQLSPYLPSTLLSEALNVTCHIQDDDCRADALNGLVPYLPETLFSEAFNIALNIQVTTSQFKAFISLSPYHPESLSEAIKMAFGIQSDDFKADALSKLSSYLPEVLLLKAIQIVRGIQVDFLQAYALSSLAPRLPNKLLLETFEMVFNIKDDYYLVKALSRLAPHLHGELFIKAFRRSRNIPNIALRADLLNAFAPYLSEELLFNALEFESKKCIQKDLFKPETLRNLAPHLPKKLLLDAFNMACNIQDEYCRSEALGELAPYLSKELLLDVFNMACNIQDEDCRNKALGKLAPYLPKEMLLEIFTMTRNIQDVLSQSRALICLAPYLPDVIVEALEMALKIKDESSRINAFINLIPYLPDIITETLEMARKTKDEPLRINTFINLIPYLPDIISETLEMVCNIKDESSRVSSLIILSPCLSNEMISNVFLTLRNLDSVYLSAALIGFAPCLSNEMLSEALSMINELDGEVSQSSALIALIPLLPEKMLLEVLSIVRCIKNTSFRADALIALIPRIPDIVSEALDVVRSIQDKVYRVNALVGLVPYISDIVSDTLAEAYSIQDKVYRVNALVGLAPYLSGVGSDSLGVVRSICDEFQRANALIALVPYMSEHMLIESFNVACGIQDKDCRCRVFRFFIAETNLGFFHVSFWPEVLHALSSRDRKHLLEDIPKLAPAIIHLSDRSTLNLVVQAMREVCQQWP